MSKQAQNTVKHIKSTSETDKELSAAIMLAIEIDSTFKLYSFRIISAEQYQARIKDLLDFYKSQNNG